MARDRRDIRRPSEKKIAWIFPFFLILIGIGAFFLLFDRETFNSSEKENDKKLFIIEENLLEKEDDKKSFLFEENNLLKKEIDSLKQDMKSKNSALDSYKSYVGRLEQDIVSLKSEIKVLSEENKFYKDKEYSETDIQNRSSNNRPGPRLFIPSTDLSKKEKEIRGPKVIYPRRALERGITGEVILLFDVSQEGEPYNIRIISSSSSTLNQAAIKAVQKMLYEPALNQRGEKIPSRDLTRSIRFKIED